MQIISLPTPLPAPGTVPEIPSPFDPALGLPCRRCQANSLPSQKIRLISYNPFLPPFTLTPYAHPGPIFIHDSPCEPYSSSKIHPRHEGRTFAVKGFDKEGKMPLTAVVEGSAEVERVVEGWFKDGEVEFVHVHFAGPGCFAFKVVKD